MSDLTSQRYQVQREISSIEESIRNQAEMYRQKLIAESTQLRILREKLASLNASIEDIRRARQAEVAIKNSESPLIGVKVYQWCQPYTFCKYQKTGVSGVFEVLDEDTFKFGQRRGGYSVNVGDIVIRQLKKDGSKSKIYHASRFNHREQRQLSDFYGWHPEGVDPNEKKSSRS